METEQRKNFLINLFYFLSITAGIFIISRFLLKYLTPFLIGGVIAWAVQKPAIFISEKTGVKRSFCAIAAALLLFVLLAGICILLMFTLIDATGGLIGEISGKTEEIINFLGGVRTSLNGFFEKMPAELYKVTDEIYKNAFQKSVSWLTGIVSSFAGDVAKRAPEFLFGFVVSLVAACYIGADFPSLMRFLKGVIGKKIYSNLLKVKNIFVNSIFLLIKGYLILMLLTFMELLIGLMILRVKFALVLAILISVIDILPVLGTGTVLVPWAVIELLLKNPERGIGLIILYLIITVVRNFAEPRIIGGQMGINPLFTLLSMFIGIKLFGIAGVFILPTAFIVVVKYYKNELENEKEQGLDLS